jgi:hypothetical protein
VNTSTPTPPTCPYHLVTIYWTPTDVTINITSLTATLTRKSNPKQLQAAQTYITVKKQKMFSVQYVTDAKCNNVGDVPQD